MRMGVLLYGFLALAILFQPNTGCTNTQDKEENVNINQQAVKNHTYSNHLIEESSPYLLQHAHNPVNWYPWTDEALQKARDEDKPIFLSIGYAACHWCHVMEKESFENIEIANILNDNFISIKVDREQRPDLDQIYMAATTAIAGRGGWPMSVFLTPELKPFFAGTYFPPDDRYGKPGFKRLITELSSIYKNDRPRIENVADNLTQSLISSYTSGTSTSTLDRSMIASVVGGLKSNFDKTNGGFGGAPKFPHPTDLSFLLKWYAVEGDKDVLQAAEHSLMQMARGGIFDQIGGGFHRYSTDAKWLVPHFEKMLYDNAMLTVTYSEAYQITGNEFYRKVAVQTLDFMLREMTDKEGGFYSSLDADSEGEEGKFYVWEKNEIDQILGDDTKLFCDYYNISTGGNFEHGTNIPNINAYSDNVKSRSNMTPKEFEDFMTAGKKRLFNIREKRIRPFTDDKILTSWNGLSISGLSWGYRITQDDRYRNAAVKAAEFIIKNMYENERLIHSYRDGRRSSGQFLEDYGYFIAGLIDLYEISYDYRWIEYAQRLAETSTEIFAAETGHLYLSPANQSDHFMRPKDIHDGALPAPGSVLIGALLKLSDITGEEHFGKSAEKYLSALSGNMTGIPYGMVSAVSALHYMLSDHMQVVLVGKEKRGSFLNEIYAKYLPNSILIVSEKGDEKIALLEGKQSDQGTTAYICRNFACRLPVTDIPALKSQLDEIYPKIK